MRMEVQPTEEARDMNLAAISMAGVGECSHDRGQGLDGQGDVE